MENGLALAHDANGVHGTMTTEGNNGYPSLNGHTAEIPQAATQQYNPQVGTATIVTEGNMEEVTRGRTTSRDEHNDEGDTAGGSGDAGGESRADKRRRSRKGLDKKFTCPTENCGKQYSRAEHLYRHQLNREDHHQTSVQGTILLTKLSRQSKGDLSLRLPRLPQAIRTSRSLCPTSRTTYPKDSKYDWQEGIVCWKWSDTSTRARSIGIDPLNRYSTTTPTSSGNHDK